MEVRPCGGAVAHISFVIAAAGAKWPGPASTAVGLAGDVILLQKIKLHQPVDAFPDGSQFVRVRGGEAMAKCDVTVGGNSQQPETGPARVGFAVSPVDLLERVPDI